MGKVFKLLAQMVGFVILAGVILFILYGLVKLTIFLAMVASIVIGLALAFIIAVALIMGLVEMIKKIYSQKDTKKT
jgi:hypothetical protein